SKNQGVFGVPHVRAMKNPARFPGPGLDTLLKDIFLYTSTVSTSRSHKLKSQVAQKSEVAPRWVHAERLVHKLDTFTDEQRKAQACIRELIWSFYRDLKVYRQNPSRQRQASLRARFERIFTPKTGFVTLDRLLTRLHANKRELLMVLDRPEIPLHTNGSENDVRCQVTKRKVSG